MTHDDRISSYIDNEFSAEHEQEFLIALASSEALRKSFRSELVLKKVLHHDEAVLNPPRNLRGAVFATLGLGAGLSGSGLSATKAGTVQAASSGSVIKALFATKLSTLVTVASLSVAALVGYGVRAVVNPVVPQVQQVTRMAQPVSPSVKELPSTNVAPNVSSAPISNEMKSAENKPVVHSRSAHAMNHQQNAVQTRDSEPVSGAAGGGPVSLEPPKISPGH